jgi:pimeloyl-ACP methyl ester carboxylesterase
VLPGLGNNSGDYDALGAKLRASGLHVSVAGVSRLDWARNAAGLRDPAYWAGTLKPRPTVDWYLDAVRRAVDEAQASTSNAPITLLAHSAGGWLGRLFLLEFGTAGVDRFVSLGSPHLPPPAGVIDQTRGILTFIDGACPGCHHAELQYVTVAGKFIEGAPLAGPGTWKQRFVGAAYKQVRALQGQGCAVPQQAEAGAVA